MIVLLKLGDHVPLIPLVEIVGRGELVIIPSHIGQIGSKVGKLALFERDIVPFKLTEPQPPTVLIV